MKCAAGEVGEQDLFFTHFSFFGGVLRGFLDKTPKDGWVVLTRFHILYPLKKRDVHFLNLKFMTPTKNDYFSITVARLTRNSGMKEPKSTKAPKIGVGVKKGCF